MELYDGCNDGNNDIVSGGRDRRQSLIIMDWNHFIACGGVCDTDGDGHGNDDGGVCGDGGFDGGSGSDFGGILVS